MKSLETFIRCMLPALGAICLSSCASTLPPNSFRAQITVTGEIEGPLSRAVFGQILEKDSTGEPGPELVADARTGALPDDLVTELSNLKVPLIRYPGGRDADQTDWTDTIHHAPNRKMFLRSSIAMTRDGHKYNTRFGVDEFGRLKQSLQCEAMVTVNLLDALARRGPVREAAERAGGIVAYCNATARTKLSRQMKHWPGIRDKNGNPIPFGIEYVQLGNRIADPAFRDAISHALPSFDRKQLAQWYVDCVTVYIQHIRMADPSIKIIIDGEMGDGIEEEVLSDKYVLDNIDLLSYSWTDPNVAPDTIAARTTAHAERFGKPAAITEWRWLSPPQGTNSASSEIIAYGQYLNALIRHGSAIQLAAHSILLGGHRESVAIRVDPSRKTAPHLTSRGAAIRLYSSRHGNQRLSLTPANETEPLVDAAATISESALYLHVVNTSADKNAFLKIDCSAHRLDGSYTITTLSKQAHSESAAPPASSEGVFGSAGKIHVSTPPASISVLEFRLASR